jgi:hypothetical protein
MEVPMNFKHILAMIVVAFAAIWIANNVSVVGGILGQS